MSGIEGLHLAGSRSSSAHTVYMLPIGVGAADGPQQYAVSLNIGMWQVGASKENSLAGTAPHVCRHYSFLFHRDTVLQTLRTRRTFNIGRANLLLTLLYCLFCR